MIRLKNSLPLITWLLAAIPIRGNLPAAPFEKSQTVEQADGAVVCVPDIYFDTQDECLPLGPAETLASLEKDGIPYPDVPLPAYTPQADLNLIPYHYFKVTEGGAPLYDSLEAAAGNEPFDRLSPGFLFVSYVGTETDENGHRYYLLRSGELIGMNGGRLAVPEFQGLLFSSQPARAFGWILGETRPRPEPGLQNPESDQIYYRYHVVQVYAIKEASNLTWLEIGPDEWVDSRQVARVEPRTTHPQEVSSNRWIEINLFEQTLAVYENDRLIFSTLVASGVKPYWTRPGVFQIYEKKETETMSGSSEADRSDYYYLEDVPWTMYFDEKRALHAAYWHNGFGYARSHGCVNLSVGDSHWLYNWANVGEQVYVYDPSGQTPMDPALYGAGAP
jgi:hypothetical protein